MAYVGIYGVLGAYAALGNVPHPFGRLDTVQILLPLIMIPSVIASFVRPGAVLTTIILYFVAAAYFLIRLHFFVIVPFLIVGGIFYMRLSRVCDAFVCLQKQPGYPDFMPLTADIIEKKKPVEPVLSEESVTLDFTGDSSGGYSEKFSGDFIADPETPDTTQS
jgi:hypothetical protein